MPRPAQIPDLERQVGNIISRVETLERKRPEVTRPEPEPEEEGVLAALSDLSWARYETSTGSSGWSLAASGGAAGTFELYLTNRGQMTVSRPVAITFMIDTGGLSDPTQIDYVVPGGYITGQILNRRRAMKASGSTYNDVFNWAGIALAGQQFYPAVYLTSGTSYYEMIAQELPWRTA